MKNLRVQRKQTLLERDGKPSTTVSIKGAPPPLDSRLAPSGTRFRAGLAKTLSKETGLLQDFWLDEIITPALKIFNAAADASEVAASVLESSPGIEPLRASAQNYLATGLRIKILRKVASELKLGPDDSALLVSLCFQPRESDPLKDLLKMINKNDSKVKTTTKQPS